MNIDSLSKYNMDYKVGSNKFKNSNFLEIGLKDVCTCSNVAGTNNIPMNNYKHANCDLTSHNNCSNINLYNAIILDEYNSKMAGASKLKHHKRKSTDESSHVSLSKKPDYIEKKYKQIKLMGDEIIEKIKKDNIQISDDMIIQLINNIKVGNQDLYIDRSTKDDVVNYINFVLNKELFKTYDHTLTTFIKDTNDFEQIKNLIRIQDYAHFNYQTKLRAQDYSNICLNYKSDPYFYYNKHETVIPAMIFALFGSKIPILFDLAVYQDLFQMMEEIENNNYGNYKNILLLLYRLADKDQYILKGHRYDKHSNSEYTRIFLAIALKKIIYGMMENKISSKLMGAVMNILNKFYDPTCKNKDELFLTSILKIWSFKPTLINTIQGEYKSVYFYEYDINNTTIDVLANFSNDILNFSYFDNKTNRIYFSLKNYYDYKNSSKFPTINNINNIGNFNMLQNNMFSKGMSIINYGPSFNSTIFKTTGVLIVSTPRHKYLLGSSDNLINVKQIDFQPIINIGTSILELRSAVCHKIHEKILNVTDCGMKPSVGRFALLKINSDKWIKYDPDFNVNITDTLTEIYNLHSEEAVGGLMDDNFTTTFLGKSDHDLKKEFRNGDLLYSYMIISNAKAMSYISMYSSIIIYSQNYDLFASQCLNKCF